MKEEILKVSQSTVAQALAEDYFCIYYVNVNNNKFIEYSASPEYRSFGLPSIGDDFIAFSREKFELLIHPDDREIFLERFKKENVVASLNKHATFTMTFRLMFSGVPTYVHLKVTRMIEEEVHHAVVGISSVDEQMRAREAFEQAHHASINYSRVAQALAADYFSIYIVDPDTEHFVQYSATEEFDRLGIEKSGENFFSLSRENMSRIIYPGDYDRFMAIFTREKIMEILERDGSFTMKYRLMFGDTPVFVSMKATLLEDERGRHLVIGTNNIDAQMRREQEYQERMAEARNRAKNDFLAHMSHDIRTPMNAIVGYTNIAKAHPDDPELIRNSLDKIGSSSHFLLSLINDVLDMSKIESGKMQLSVNDCDLGAIFRRIEDITSMQAKNKSLQISYDYSGVQHYHVRGDELRIEQVLINIVSNAIKYTPEGKSVDLIAKEEVLPDPGKIRYCFIVRDTGVGISEEYLPHIFESFTREESSLVNRVQGSGLGLAITTKVVKLMGGTISVTSKLGEGSEFTVELDLEVLKNKKDTKDLKDAKGTKDTDADGDGGTALESAGLDGRKILLVEDHDINAEIAAMILSQYGIQVDRAENGQVGLSRLQEAGAGAYDAILMDIQMPVMNGYEATRAIRALPDDYYQNLPIIAMSANAYEDDVRACLESGMNAHVAKPFDPDELYAVLESHIL